MKKALKELIENAPVKRTGRFTELMFVPGSAYRGFYGNTGFNKIIVLGKNVDDETWYRIVSDKNECDKFDIYNLMHSHYKTGFNLDIPEKYKAIRIWFSGMYFNIDYSLPISSLVAELEKRK